MNDLENRIKEAETTVEQIMVIVQKKQTAQRECDEILADGKIDSGKEAERFSRAKFVLDLCVPQEEKLRQRLASFEAELPDLISREVNRFNKLVMEVERARKEEIRAANAPFFNGQPRLLNQLVEQGHFPAVYELQRKAASVPYISEPLPGEMVNAARSVVAHIRRVSKELNL